MSLHAHAESQIKKICDDIGTFYGISEFDFNDKREKIEVRLNARGLSFVVTFFIFTGHDTYQREVSEFKKMLGRRLDYLEEDIKVIRDRLREEEPDA